MHPTGPNVFSRWVTQEASAEEQKEYDREKVGDVKIYCHSMFEEVFWYIINQMHRS